MLFRLCTVLIINVKLIYIILRCKTNRFRTPYGPFDELKRSVLNDKMIHAGMM